MKEKRKIAALKKADADADAHVVGAAIRLESARRKYISARAVGIVDPYYAEVLAAAEVEYIRERAAAAAIEKEYRCSRAIGLDFCSGDCFFHD